MNKLPPLAALVAWIAITYSAALVGGQFMPDLWYATLQKPSWNPPGWIFGPVWSALYTLMAISAWLVWRRGGWRAQRTPLLIFLAQLALNAAWTPLFFGLHRPDLAFFEILLVWLGIIVTICSFWRVHRTAAALLFPYLAWVSFASCLNYTIWKLNS